MGAAVFNYPVTFNPFIALAGAIELGVNNYANDAVVKKLGTTSCTIDSTPSAYTSPYRVVVIGRNYTVGNFPNHQWLWFFHITAVLHYTEWAYPALRSFSAV